MLPQPYFSSPLSLCCCQARRARPRQETSPADTTIGDRFALSEFPGVGYFVTAFPIGHNFAVTAGVEVPYLFTPTTSIGVTPLVGLAYRIPRT